MRSLKDVQARLLDWISEQSAGDPAGVPDLRPFADAEGLNVNVVDSAAHLLQDRGLLRLLPGMLVPPHAQLTPQGNAEAQEQRQRRHDPALRRRACRDAFLRWLSEQQPADPYTDLVGVAGFLETEHALYEGDKFTVTDVEYATEYLKGHGLIDGVDVAEMRGVIMARILPEGLDCIDDHEASVSDYINRGQRAGTTITTHFNAPVSGQVGIGHNVSQAQTPAAVDADVLQRLLDDVLEAARQIHAAEAAHLLTYADTLRAELTTESPNPDMIIGSGNRLKEIAAKAGNATLSSSVGALVGYIFKALGLGG